MKIFNAHRPGDLAPRAVLACLLVAARNVFPPDGSTGVQPQVIFFWEDPTIDVPADAVFVSVEGAVGNQDDNSVLGMLSIEDTSLDLHQQR